MKGVGKTTGAITFLNALATGRGSAAGVTLPAEATVELTSAPAPGSVTIEPRSDTPLVRATLQAALRQWAPGRSFAARVEVESEVPAARGLKSSSAVSSAVALATAAALDVYVSATEVARLSADVSQSIGVSATGAFDDALASLEPGVHVTDNARRERLRTDVLDPTWQVILWIPNQTHPPSPEYRKAFHELSSLAAPAEDAARRGDPLAAMEANTTVVERAMGYEYAAVRRDLLRAGALASGVSGLGPSLATIVTADRISPVLRALPHGAGDVLVTRFTSRPARASAGAL